MNTNPYKLLEKYIEKEKSIKDFSNGLIDLMFHTIRLDMENDTKSLYIQSIGKEVDLLLSVIEQLENKNNLYHN